MANITEITRFDSMVCFGNSEATSKDIIHFFMEYFHVIPSICLSAEYPEGTRVNIKSNLYKGVVVFYESGEVCSIVPPVVDRIIKENYRVDGVKWQNTLHPDWNVAMNGSLTTLITTQLMHYLSTYGLEAMGYEASPYIPVREAFKDSKVQPNFKAYTVFRMVDSDTAFNMAKEYICNVQKPNNDWTNIMIALMDVLDIEPEDLKSFELQVARCDQLNTIPRNGQDWMRYVIYKVTGNTLMVKDKKTINAIRDMMSYQQEGYYYNYLCKVPEKELAKIFFRFKPFFMAMRADYFAHPIINRVRKLAEKYHQPLNENNVQNIANLIKQEANIGPIIDKCSVRQKIKLMNFFKQELPAYCVDKDEDVDKYLSRVYSIRNGKTFVRTDIGMTSFKNNYYAYWYGYLVISLREQLNDKFKGKTFFIPENVHYTAPVSEKQFIGNIPMGTCFPIPSKDVCNIAIYWENHENRRTDLDLHMESLTASYGWNSSYRGDGVTYSGDMTDATNGAVEAYRFNSSKDEEFMLSVNNFTSNYTPGAKFKLFVTDTKRENPSLWGNSHAPMVDVSEALFAPINLQFEDENSMILGMIYDGGFYFYNGKVGQSIVPKHDLYKQFIRGIQLKLSNMFFMKDYLELGGAKIISENSLKGLTKEEVGAIMSNVIDLSPENLTASTLIDLIDEGDKNTKL